MIRPIAPPVLKRRRQPGMKTVLRRAIDATKKSGVPVQSVRIYPDGSFTLSSAPLMEPNETSLFEQWEERL